MEVHSQLLNFDDFAMVNQTISQTVLQNFAKLSTQKTGPSNSLQMNIYTHMWNLLKQYHALHADAW